MPDHTYADVLQALRENQSDEQQRKVSSHVHTTSPDSAVLGVRMGTVFEIAKAHQSLELSDVEALLESTWYEARLAAVSVLDFSVRPVSRSAQYRAERYELYRSRHDRIDNWDLVDRSAPRVVGQYLADHDRAPLYDLARSADRNRRRTATVAGMWFARSRDLGDVFGVSDLLLDDVDDSIHKAVGATLRYATVHDEPAVIAYLESRLVQISRPTLIAATDRLNPTEKLRLRNHHKSS